jgi:transposase
MNTREERGVVIAAMCRLTFKGGVWHVPSQTDGEKTYRVDLSRNTCTCPDHTDGGHVCKHVFAVKIVARRELSADGTVTEQRSFTFTEKKVYKRNWSAYTEAQTTEKPRFQELLADLCRGIPEPKRVNGRAGRPRVPFADRVFATTFKTYSTFSSRRFAADMDEAAERGLMSRPIHYSNISVFLDDDDLTPILKTLVAKSGLPLRSLERSFAVDSSGFTTSRFIRWYDMKYGRERSEHDWVKVHLATGVRTNVVTAAAIYGRDTNDCPILPELVNETNEAGFSMEEVSADKGYLSVENVETIFAVGAKPFIAFKANSTGAAGGLFEKMYHFYKYNQKEYMDRYHQRSNVESTFSMIKRKFGDSLRCKTPAGMRNEVYCKLIAHNLCQVIQSQVELGIEAVFWPEAISVRPQLSLHQG